MCGDYTNWKYISIKIVDISVVEFMACISNGRISVALFKIILILLED